MFESVLPAFPLTVLGAAELGGLLTLATPFPIPFGLLGSVLGVGCGVFCANSGNAIAMVSRVAKAIGFRGFMVCFLMDP